MRACETGAKTAAPTDQSAAMALTIMPRLTIQQWPTQGISKIKTRRRGCIPGIACATRDDASVKIGD